MRFVQKTSQPAVTTNGDRAGIGVDRDDSKLYINITGTPQQVVLADGAQTIQFANGTAAAPSIAFASDTDTGLFRSTEASVDVVTNGTVSVRFNGTDLRINQPTGVLGWVATANGTPDTILAREAANTLALRNGTNAQALRLYNTYTDASNFERLTISWTSNILGIGIGIAGTGTARQLRLGASGSTDLLFNTGGTDRWQVTSAGHIIAATDNTYDIGAPVATRPRNIHVGGYLAVADGITAPGTQTGEARIYVDTADGDLKVKFGDGTVKTISTDT
jgi:hypothetical protein